MRGKRRIIEPGSVFGRLTVLKEEPTINSVRRLLCVCECGNILTPRLRDLLNGSSKSCGCLCNDNHRKHGLSKTPLYAIWWGIRRRCKNKDCKDYKDYGGRGIKMCEDWNDFMVFYQWSLLSGWVHGLQINRIDNNGDYSPNNCIWSTPTEQARNTRRNFMVEYNGEYMPLVVLLERLNISHKYSTIHYRLRYMSLSLMESIQEYL